MASATLTEAIDRLCDIADALLTQPLDTELAALWSIGFALPVICFLAAHSVGVLVNFWRRN
jgi:hypothetical protein